MFDTVIHGGTIYTPEQSFVGDIGINGETIAEIKEGGGLEGTQVIDATNKCVFPGFIDPHVHIHLPFMGTNAIDDHESASKAALVGGTTTIIEMICPGPDDEPASAFTEWKDLAEDGCCCDYTFHLAVVRFDELAKEQLRKLVANEGVQSFKIFLAYKGALNISDENLLELMKLAKELGVTITAHCENAEAIDSKQKELLTEGKTGPEWHEPSRPRNVEAGGVQHLCEFAEQTGATVYVVHTSCGEAVSRAMEAKERGVDVTVEAVAPHLVLDKTYAERPNFEGAKFVMSPPLRDEEEHEALWNGLATGLVSTIGTDHAPFNFKGQKDMGTENFTLIPNGIPSIQERIDLVHTYGVCKGKIDSRTMVDVCSTNVAKQFNMFPRKGALVVGSDADIVVYDTDYVGTFKHEDGISKIDYCGFEGMERKGRSDVVFLRGKVVAEQGKFVGETGSGIYLPR
ncbi:MAG TPA: dihydropyrimidinase [Phycisphaerales bacterium]|jgi:dihydropyrimidinase|nr:dihydropyrimidinase [Phycisphaerales bacterium]